MTSTIQNTVHSAIAEAREGEILAGKYRIESVLGQGGMGVVVAARHLQLDEMVAIKFLLPAALERPESVARFLREAKAAIRIKSEHVVRVSDVGTLENGAPYMVMEFLEGCDLSKWLKRRGVMSVEQVVEFILQALEAIADAHGQGIIHRDLKPANLYCVRRSDGLLTIKVLDFGISKVQDLTPTGPELQMTAAAAIGSPLYMSPEQMRSARDVDARTDIWSIGVILYELLTGTPPFRGDTISEICVKAASFSPPPMRNLRPDLPLELRAVILKCLEKSPDDRYANVAQLATALLPFAPRRARPSVERIGRIIAASGLSDSVVCAPISSEKVSAVSHSATSVNWGLGLPFSQLGRWGQFGILALLVCTMAGSVFWLVRRNSPVEASGAPATPSSFVVSTSAATPLPAPIDVYPMPNDQLPDPPSSVASAGLPKAQSRYNAQPASSTEPAGTRQKVRPPTRQDPSNSDIFNTPH